MCKRKGIVGWAIVSEEPPRGSTKHYWEPSPSSDLSSLYSIEHLVMQWGPRLLLALPSKGEEQEPNDQSPRPCSLPPPCTLASPLSFEDATPLARSYPLPDFKTSSSTSWGWCCLPCTLPPKGHGDTHTCYTCSRRAAGWPGSPRLRSAAGSSALALCCSPAPPGHGRMGRAGIEGSERACGGQP